MAQPAEREMFPKEKLELALKAREQFLKEQPHLQSLQDEIDRILENTVGFENRMSVLLFMIEAKLAISENQLPIFSHLSKQKSFLMKPKLKMPIEYLILIQIRMVI